MLPTACRRFVPKAYRPSFSLSGARRSLSTISTGPRPGAQIHSGRARIGTLAVAGALGISGYAYLQRSIRADADDENGSTSQQPRQQLKPLGSLIRSYIVYSLCSIPLLVDYSPSILLALSSVPGVGYLTEAFVRETFFAQFVGGDTALETLPVLEQLRAENKGTLFAYSVEVDEDEAAGKVKIQGPKSGQAQAMCNRLVDEMIHCIDVAADFEDQRNERGKTASGRRTWVAIKLSALLPDARALINFSKHLVDTRPSSVHQVCFPGSPRRTDFGVLDTDALDLPSTCPLTKENLDALRKLKEDLRRVCQRAREREVKIVIDAEYSWYQPAIEAYQYALMAEFNSLPQKESDSLLVSIRKKVWTTPAGPEKEIPVVQPLVYGTFQAYLRRTPEYLAQSLLDAEAGNFALGVKLVRGAYHPNEVSMHATRRFIETEGKAVVSASSGLSSLSISPEEVSPVWETKQETDECYDACARMLVDRVAADVDVDAAKRAGRQDIAIPKLGVLFGTHNWESCGVILDMLVTKGIATRACEGDKEVVLIPDETAERVTLGQLYGMRDSLTDYLVEKTRSRDPFVIKYVPYGKLSEVMPYLGRRAIENKSVLGNGVAQEERKRAGSEIIKCLWSLLA